MTAVTLLHRLHDLGISVRINGARLIVTPGSAVTDVVRARLLSSKPELLLLPGRLAAAIHRCCDVRGDDVHNSELLVTESLALPARDQADLLGHFEAEALRWFGMQG